MKEFHKVNPTLKENFINSKYPQSRRTMIENAKFLDKIPKKNLPELRLTKTKVRPGSDPELEHNRQNKISTKTGLKYSPLIPKFQKNHALVKKTELMFPKIKNGTTNNFNNEHDRNMIVTNYNNNNRASSKRKNIHSQRNTKNRNLYGNYGVNNANNINQIQNKNTLNVKVNDIEKNNIETYNLNNNLNYAINLQKIKPRIPRYPRGNKSMPSKITTKVKKVKANKNEKNSEDSLTIHPITNYPNNNNFLGSNSLFNNELNGKKPSNNNLNNNLIPVSNIGNSSILNSFSSTQSSLPTTNSFTEYDLMAERLSILHNLFNSLTSLTGGTNPFCDLNQPQKTVELSPEIFSNTYKNFIPSITSSPHELSITDIIKGYAYNSSMGNIRDYNEDTITATKIILNNDDSFYFFGVYDGHGGSGCSLYLKNNLHNYIKQFSKEGIENAINEVEENFIKKEALDEKGEIKDQSGSCGIIAMIQKNKCIISNVGDSRLVLYKNNSVFFCTEDHKPGSKVEKERIEKAGGKIYQTPSIFPLYQNGKQIEIPWRVLPGRLSVSRTFGDVEAKEEKFGGNKNVVVACPDITEIDLDNEFNLIVLGCDGIFDVLSNEEILECIRIVLKEKKITEVNDLTDISELCGDFAAMIIKSALAKDSFDNVSCIVIALNIKDLLNN